MGNDGIVVYRALFWVIAKIDPIFRQMVNFKHKVNHPFLASANELIILVSLNDQLWEFYL